MMFVFNGMAELLPAGNKIRPEVIAAGINRGYAVDSRTYYILGLNFWQSEADKLGQVPEAPELFA